jgi:outer membrane protein OmpA-like peptidoglycan-associated protein
MKKILLASILLVGGSSFAQNNDAFNKTSVDFSLGMNYAFRSDAAGQARGANFPHIDAGARYMLTNKFGVYGGLGWEQYRFKSVSGLKEGRTNAFSIQALAVWNLTNTFDIGSVPKLKKFGAYLLAGPRAIFNSNKYNDVRFGTEALMGLSLGGKLQYKASNKLAITAGVEGMTYILQNKTLDFFNKIEKSPAGLSANLTFGVNYYLGDKAEHADWTVNQYGDLAALAALKAKIEKAEKDMMDDDKDGVPNYLDQEPGTAAGANVDTKGKTVKVEKVVDMDGDGVLDVNDFCPTIKGSATANGCPDKDGDGIYDFADKCPNAAGLAADGGCPVVKQKEKEVMQKAMAGVQFDNGKATLIKTTTPILDEVAKVMLANPSYNLAVNGHTDNAGDPAKNLQLSEDRAKAVKAYLMGKGVAENRINAKGFGDTQPKASNATAKGKAANRRVEFLVTFEQ